MSTPPFALILAHSGKPIFAGGGVFARFAPVRALFACGRPKPVPMAIECEAEELLQCTRVEFPIAARGRVSVKRRPPAAVEYSLQAQFITYQTRNSVQSNGATSVADALSAVRFQRFPGAPQRTLRQIMHSPGEPGQARGALRCAQAMSGTG